MVQKRRQHMPKGDKVPFPTIRGRVVGFDDCKKTITVDDHICWVMLEIWDWVVENITFGMNVEVTFSGRSYHSEAKQVREVK